MQSTISVVNKGKNSILFPTTNTDNNSLKIKLKRIKEIFEFAPFKNKLNPATAIEKILRIKEK